MGRGGGHAQEIADLVAGCMDLTPGQRPTAREVFERIRDAMSQLRPGQEEAPVTLQRDSSRQAQLMRRESMREALKQL